MEVIQKILDNKIIVICFVAWLIAQVLKTILDFFVHKEFKPERLVGSGGMPSSHSALVISLVIAVGRIEGVGSTYFAISCVLAGVVIYDAMGVRRAAGEQAKVLNTMVLDFKNMTEFFNSLKKQFLEEGIKGVDKSSTDFQKVLKEYLGHTPLEVLAGSIIGILVGALVPIN